ncbi:MAG: AmmeMemoRadiSam system protein B [Spirochaetaceae bacterium]|jgi:AmmeMemoRadiSam system protein B|nr:AmmeMemoRadiSam system protein B [Spirochaetaceae bacterium]
MREEKRIRPQLGAGLLYPDTKEEIEEEMRAFGLGRGRVRAIMSPHAAFGMSGAASAAAYNEAMAFNNEIKHIVLLGGVHESEEAGIFLSESDAFETPLGNIPVEKSLNEALSSCATIFRLNDLPHLQESCCDVQLPFIKNCFPKCSILPILLSCPKKTGLADKKILIDSLANSLFISFESLLDKTLFVISANLGLDINWKVAEEQSKEIIRLLEDEDYEQYIKAALSGEASFCGAYVTAALLKSHLLDDCICEMVPGTFGTGAQAGMVGYYASLAWKK